MLSKVTAKLCKSAELLANELSKTGEIPENLEIDELAFILRELVKAVREQNK